MDNLGTVIQILKGWADEPHDVVCEGPHQLHEPCRHDRARTALVQIENAMEKVLRDEKVDRQAMPTADFQELLPNGARFSSYADWRLAREIAGKAAARERESCAKTAEDPGCSCKAENTHDGCCGACGFRIAKAIRKAT